MARTKNSPWMMSHQKTKEILGRIISVSPIASIKSHPYLSVSIARCFAARKLQKSFVEVFCRRSNVEQRKLKTRSQRFKNFEEHHQIHHRRRARVQARFRSLHQRQKNASIGCSRSRRTLFLGSREIICLEHESNHCILRMSRSLATFKRKREDSGSAQTPEGKILNLIKGKEDMGIWKGDLKRETNLPDKEVDKVVKLLLAQKLIKEVVNIQSKGRKLYMATEFEPSKDVTGGAWYVGGNLDTTFIGVLKKACEGIIRKLKVATLEAITDFFKKNRITKDECTPQQIAQILRSMVLDNEIIEVKSTGLGEYASIPMGTVCYRSATGQGPKTGAMASIPCGVCPRITQCSPDGLISPQTCVYFTKWLDIEF
ncbi:uncharacterized protein LOC132295216 isoform X2 [Cornus florida]|uniref:uncharacterized protein LOC132295216 isoform X2 n=1 Tax=Cornus florida TaxID=4283 RepID=UPI00289BF523|nr:uncharacterized protein LOC132295216 isoform X2 [Cornus florida]